MDASVSVASQSIIELLRELSAHLNRDKKAICGALSLTNQTILNWYNTLNDTFTVEITRSLVNEGSKRTEEEIQSIISFTRRAEYSPPALACIEFLTEVRRRWESGELRRVVNELDTQKLSNIEGLVRNFNDYATQGKAERFSLDRLRQSRGGIDEAEMIQQWLMEMNELREKIRSLVSQAQLTLRCPILV